MIWVIGSTIVAAFMAITMIFVRLRAAKAPTSVKKIILPPLFMSTGAFMFIFPVFQISWLQVLEAFLIGMIFSVFLIKSSKFEINGNDIYMNPSKAFPVILLSLLAVRLVLKLIIGSVISFGETSGMFFMLAFGMIVTWRIAMLYKYLQLRKLISA